MQITQFIQNNLSDFQILLQNKNMLLFYSKEYQPIFFSYFFQKLKTNLSIVNINIADHDFNQIKPQLEMSFLGRKSFYWLGNVSQLGDKKIKEIIDYLNAYVGPNQIGLFLEEEAKINEDKFVVVHCTGISNLEQVEPVLNFLEIKKEIAFPYFEETFKTIGNISLDQALILTYYVRLIGKKADAFLDNWLDKVFVTEQSLFTLSKFLFSKDTKQFFYYWNLISPNYQPVFWVTFWSEQLFRAYWYIKFMNLGRIVEAKQMAYRLPFSFIQYDWKKHNLEKIQAAHQLIYDIDFSLKNGGSELSLDLFYAKFLEK
ncbi:MAG: hypothetical protein P4L22_02775 [Candidatus Babeliales bacterium]|nr:hypothetical protein [Candidatus Babeliales bacterium]